MRNVNWWLVLATFLCLGSFGLTITAAALGMWDCVVGGAWLVAISYGFGRLIEDASA